MAFAIPRQPSLPNIKRKFNGTRNLGKIQINEVYPLRNMVYSFMSVSRVLLVLWWFLVDPSLTLGSRECQGISPHFKIENCGSGCNRTNSRSCRQSDRAMWLLWPHFSDVEIGTKAQVSPRVLLCWGMGRKKGIYVSYGVLQGDMLWEK